MAGASVLLCLAVSAGTWNGFRAPVLEAKPHVPGCLWLEAEQFADYSGWKLDTQYVGQMGSAYLIAPGVTGTVAAASTSVNVPNLWMCGRCASMTHRALGSMRVQSTCAVTGEAAGRAAGVCALRGWTPREYGQKAFLLK